MQLVDPVLTRLSDADLNAVLASMITRVVECEGAVVGLLVRYHAAMAQWNAANATLAGLVREGQRRGAARN